MTATRTASQTIVDEVSSWPGVVAEVEDDGDLAIKVGRRQLGHLHGDFAAHFSFPKSVWRELHAQGRIGHHPVFPGKEGPAARTIAGEDDVRDVIELLRVNYDRVMEHPPVA
jgi:Family of unknown function (DUF5519)